MAEAERAWADADELLLKVSEQVQAFFESEAEFHEWFVAQGFVVLSDDPELR